MIKMADCSKTEVFLKELAKMCQGEEMDVTKCGIYQRSNFGCSTCAGWVRRHAEDAIEIVQKWSNKHPSHSLPKTRQSEFLKIFPTALMTNNVIDIMPCEIIDEELERCSGNCAVCRKIFWLTEAE